MVRKVIELISFEIQCGECKRLERVTGRPKQTTKNGAIQDMLEKGWRYGKSRNPKTGKFTSVLICPECQKAAKSMPSEIQRLKNRIRLKKQRMTSPLNNQQP